MPKSLNRKPRRVTPFERFGNELPHSIDSENAVLGCALQSPETILPDIGENLDLFYYPNNRRLAEEMKELSAKNGPQGVDQATFTQWLRDRKMLEELGGISAIQELTSTIFSGASYVYYKGILQDKLASRRMLVACNDIAESVLGNQHDLKLAHDPVVEKMTEIRVALEGESKVKCWEEEMDSWRADWQDMAAGKKESAMDLQWPTWNRELGGITSGYTIISGESSSGKSALLGNIMRHACFDKGRPCLIFSYEMKVGIIISRLIAEIANVDGKHVFAPDKSKPESWIQKAIGKAADQIAKSKMRIIHEPNMSAEQCCVVAKKMFSEHGDLLVGVDYVQIIPPPVKLPQGYTREREVAANSESFRCLSKEIDRPVMVLSQLNSDGSTRESASVNMDCDMHVKVDRYTDRKTHQVVDNGLWVYKNRNGRKDFSLNIYLNGPRFRFEEGEFPN